MGHQWLGHCHVQIIHASPYCMHVLNIQCVVAFIVAMVKSPALNKAPGTLTHLINSSYCYD